MTTEPEAIGVVGLGLMGTAITERLIEFGYQPMVWNRSREKAEALIERGAIWSDSPFLACDRVILSLYSSQVVNEVLGLFANDLRASQVLIDTTTGEPQDTLSLANRLAVQGVTYLDAPISGSSEQTRRGEAMVMIGGDQSTFNDCNDLWPVLGKRVFYTGLSSSASRMKLVTNLVLGLNRVALAEGLAYAKAIGVSPTAALEVLMESAAYSRTMDVKGPKMVTGDFSLQARLSQHLKDVRIILETARDAGLQLPLSGVHLELLELAEAIGCGELDNSSIIKIYEGRGNG